MLGHEIQHGQVRHGGKLPGAVQLHLGDGLQTVLAGPLPVREGTRTGADRRDGVFADLGPDPTALDGQGPLADRLQPDILGEQVNRLAIRPAPVPDEHLRGGIAAMHSLLDGGIDLGQDLRPLPRPATFTIALPAVRGAIRQVLGRRDREDAAQAGNLAKHVRQRRAHPAAHAGVAGAERAVVALADARQVGPMIEKRQGHRPRLVHVKVDINTKALRAGDQPAQVGQAVFPAFPELWKIGPAGAS